MNNEEFAQKLSYELDIIVNDFLKPEPSESLVQKSMRNSTRLAIYQMLVNPAVEKARKDGPAGLNETIQKIRDGADRLLKVLN